MRTERLEVPGRLGDQLAHLRVGFDVAEIEAQPDPPAAHAIVEADRVVARVGRQRTPVARIGPGRDVERQRGVEHRARQHTLADHVGERRVGGVLGDAAVARLQSDEAGMGRGDADRAAAVIAVVERIDPGRGQRRGAARRAAGRVLQVPWIARGALQGRIGQGLPAELGGRRLAEEDKAGGLEAVDDGRVLDGSRLVGGMRAVAGRPSLDRRRVLDRGRHAVERRQGLALQPARLRGLGRRPGAVAVDKDKSIERRLQFRCTLYHRVDNIDGGKDLAGIKCCEFRCGNPGRGVIRHAFFVGSEAVQLPQTSIVSTVSTLISRSRERIGGVE